MHPNAHTTANSPRICSPFDRMRGDFGGQTVSVLRCRCGRKRRLRAGIHGSQGEMCVVIGQRQITDLRAAPLQFLPPGAVCGGHERLLRQHLFLRPVLQGSPDRAVFKSSAQRPARSTKNTSRQSTTTMAPASQRDEEEDDVRPVLRARGVGVDAARRVPTEYDRPVPGNPTVARARPLRRLTVAPRPPMDVLTPDLLRFRRTPGSSLMRF